MESNFFGLKESEAEVLLKVDGFNELPSQRKHNALEIMFKVLSEPMLLLLIITGVLYLSLGEMKDALMLLMAIFVVVGITYYQEKKTENTLEALKKLSSPRALVIRDGVQKRIPGREVVKGDVVVLREGDRVPADGVVLECENLSIDEALLTGESVPVRKVPWDGKSKSSKPGGDGLPFVFSGTMVISGRGMVEVRSTGVGTEMGKIGRSLEIIKEEDTLLHKETSKVGLGDRARRRG